MATTLEIIRPKTFAELLDAIEMFQGGSTASWYRGCRDKDHKLKPTLYRHVSKTKIDDISVLETELTTRFVQRSLPFLQRTLTNDWDKLFLMQHYGVPTRLLDWTENPLLRFTLH
jgi:FRG domain